MYISDLITRSYRLLGTVADGETPSPSLMSQGLEVLTDILDEWRGQRLAIYVQSSTAFQLTANKADYTLGPGGDFNMARPVYIDNITIQDPTMSPEFEYPPLKLFSDAEWANIRQKTLTSSLPRGCYVNQTNPLMTLSFYYVPSVSVLKAVIYAPAAQYTSAPALSDAFSMPPGYSKGLRYLLAGELSMIPGISATPRQDLFRIAGGTMATVKAANTVVGISVVDTALVGQSTGGWDWRTGEPSR